MVQRNYVGFGTGEGAVKAFDDLGPHVEALLALQAECAWGSPDHNAFAIVLDGLETAAYHFTRRRHYYDRLRSAAREAQAAGGPAGGNGRLADRAEAAAAMETLRPYAAQLRVLQDQCRPFGRDYLAMEIARQALGTCLYHFTRAAGFAEASVAAVGAAATAAAGPRA